MRILTIFAIALTMGGCATVTRGTTDTISVTSEPPGAQATTSLSTVCTTPCTFDVPRKAEFVVTFNAPGYKPQEIPVKTQIATAGAAGFVGNAVFGGVVGMGVDVATGATLERSKSRSCRPRAAGAPERRSAQSAPRAQARQRRDGAVVFVTGGRIA